MADAKEAVVIVLLLPALVLGKYNFGLEKVTGQRIPSSTVDGILHDCTLECVCWRLCRDNTSCRALTTVPVSDNGFRCEMTALFLAPSSLEDVAPVVPGDLEYVTFIKVCKDNFMGVEGAGCFFIPSQKVPFARARTACPYGSKLASLSNMTIFNKLTNHLQAFAAPAPLWVDIEKINGLWTWGDGTIDLSEPDHGEGPWVADRPSSTERTTHGQLWKMYGYLLHDTAAIDQNKAFLCQQVDQF